MARLYVFVRAVAAATCDSPTRLGCRAVACGSRWIKATVNGVDGTILLPDDRDASTYDLNDTNGGNYSSNTITAADWTNTLEANGAVFLPAVGHRMGDSFFDAGYGFYWSSSYYNSSEVCLLEINALVSKISNL